MSSRFNMFGWSSTESWRIDLLTELSEVHDTHPALHPSHHLCLSIHHCRPQLIPLFHSCLKTQLFHKAFTPQTAVCPHNWTWHLDRMFSTHQFLVSVLFHYIFSPCNKIPIHSVPLSWLPYPLVFVWHIQIYRTVRSLTRSRQTLLQCCI